MDYKYSALIVGCGYIGSHLKNFLEKKSWNVHGVKRSIGKEDTNTLSIDVCKNYSLKEKYDFVFYMISPDSYTEFSYQSAFEKGITNTLTALKDSKQKPCFIFISSTSLFAENSGNIVNEKSKIETSSFSKKYLYVGEQLVKKSGFPFSIVRFSGIYGPNRYSLIDRIKNGAALLKEKPFISNRIHLEDCLGVLYHIALSKERRPLYIASDSGPTSYNEVLLWLSKELGINPPKKEVNSRTTRHMSNKICSNQLLVQSGYTFLYPSFKEGFQAPINKKS